MDGNSGHILSMRLLQPESKTQFQPSKRFLSPYAVHGQGRHPRSQCPNAHCATRTTAIPRVKQRDIEARVRGLEISL